MQAHLSSSISNFYAFIFSSARSGPAPAHSNPIHAVNLLFNQMFLLRCKPHLQLPYSP